MMADEPPGLLFPTTADPPEANLNDSTQWPSLWHGVGNGAIGSKSPSPSEDASWEIISPTTLDPSNSASTPMSSPHMVPPLLVEEDAHIMEEGDNDDDPVVVLPKLLIRQRSASTPDFISLERKLSMVEDDAEQEEIIRHYANNTTHDSDQHPRRRTSTTRHTNALSWTGSISFRDMVLSQVRDLANEVSTPVVPPLSARSMKPKPKIVVLPRMRSYESSPNLYGLASYSTSTNANAAPATATTRATGSGLTHHHNNNNNNDDDDDLILGDTDAMEFYHRKAKGISGRTNGMKLRPDEAKRRDIIMAKKESQRQQQPQPNTKTSKK